jgi:hypothetical protein
MRETLVGPASKVARFALLAIVILGAILAVSTAAVWSGTYYAYGALSNGPAKLDVFAMSGPLSDPYGLIAVENRDTYVSVILERREWDSVLAMWRKARGVPGPMWRLVGSITETDADNARLFLFAGQGVRFVLRENRDCVLYDVAPKDEDAVERSLVRVRDHFLGKITADRAWHASLSDALHGTARAVRYWPPVPPSPRSVANPC